MTNAFKEASGNIAGEIIENPYAPENFAPVIISFYTVNTPYEQEVQALIESCDRWGLEYCIEGRPSAGTWAQNCAVKPLYIQEKLLFFKRPVVWIDADAAVLQKPDFDFLGSYDVSVRLMPFLPWKNPSKLISNTLFFNYTKSGLNILRRWARLCQKRLQRDPHSWDQAALRDIIHREKTAKILPLPIAYGKIYDLDIFFIEQQDVVIEHYQASRRLKNDLH